MSHGLRENGLLGAISASSLLRVILLPGVLAAVKITVYHNDVSGSWM